jgi:hypothetical protein
MIKQSYTIEDDKVKLLSNDDSNVTETVILLEKASLKQNIRKIIFIMDSMIHTPGAAFHRPQQKTTHSQQTTSSAPKAKTPVLVAPNIVASDTKKKKDKK